MTTVRVLAVLGTCLLTGTLGCASSGGEPTAPAEGATTGAVDAATEPAPEEAASSPEELRAAYRSAAKTFSLLPIDWRACPFFTGGSGTGASCADIVVPRSWLAPDSGTRTVFVKRIPSSAPAVQQVWLLYGGPGLSGEGGENVARVLQAQLPSAEVYILDYRGTGRSGRLACPDEEADSRLLLKAQGSDHPGSLVKRCFEAVEAEFPAPTRRELNTTESAMDVGILADALRTPGDQLTIFGLSFGTYVAHRYLHLFPERSDAVVMDSFVLPDGFTNRDLDVDRIARDILGICATDLDCAAHLGTDPTTFATSVVERLGQGHCPELASAGIDVAGFQALAARAAFDTAQRSFLPALYYRAERCAPADVRALIKYGDQPAPTGASGDSDALFFLVARSELLAQSQLDDGSATLIASAGLAAFYDAIWDAIPTYPRDAFWGKWASTDAPLLILQGELDAQTPRSNGELAHAHFSGPDVHFVSFPWTNHAVLLNFACGAAILTRFITNPRQAPDSSCTAAIVPPSFAVAPADARTRFGEPDLWQNGMP